MVGIQGRLLFPGNFEDLHRTSSLETGDSETPTPILIQGKFSFLFK